MPFIINITIIAGIQAIMAISLNLIVGYAGLLSVAHAAFFGIGAYTTAILLSSFGVSFFLSVILGMIFAGIIGFLIGLVLSKFDDDYYALASLGFGVIVYSVLLNWQGLTRGPLGIPGIERPEVFGFALTNNIHFLILTIIALALVYWFSKFIVNSSFGRVLKAIREDEKALMVFGYNTHHYKLAVFVIGAALAAIAGSLFASYISFIEPSTFILDQSIFALAVIILGGLANMRGVVLGAVFMILLPELLRFMGLPLEIAAQMRQLVYGVILVLLMLYRPQGMLGEYKLN